MVMVPQKLELKWLVDVGTNLNGINSLHLVAANYKKDDLYEHLICEYHMSVEDFDDLGMQQLCVVATCGNPDGI